MNTYDSLESQAKSMSTAELEKSLDWHKALSEHADENMDFSGYHSCQNKIKVIEAELRSRRT